MSTIDRRRFLAAAGAGLGTAASGQNTRGSKIRTGILGIQHSHLAPKLEVLYANPDYDVVAICEPDEATRRRLQDNSLFGRLRWMNMDEMLHDRNLDLIVFEGVVADAVPFGKRVLESGKHLHLEKPPTNQMAPFRGLVETARRNNRKLQLGYLYRFHAAIDAALEAVQQGWLGDIFMIRATMNSDRDAEQRAVEARYAGGSMFELGGHVIDRVIAMLGRPAGVRPWLRHDTPIADKEKDNTLAVFEYPSALALIVSSARDPAPHRSFEVLGTGGSMMIDPLEPAPTLRTYLREPRGGYGKGWQQRTFPVEVRFAKDFAELARAIRSDTPLRYSYDHELLLQETLLRASGEMR